MSDEPNDDFASILSDQNDDDAEPEKIGMVVYPRFKTSAEAEEAERRYLDSLLHDNDPDTSAAWPIPFLDDEGNVEEPTKGDAQILKERFGVTAEEYMELMKP